MPDILQVRNWEEYQHYKDRAPPWIKLHFNLLQSRDWVMLDDAGRVLAIACMLLASRSDLPGGQFEACPLYFRRVAYLNSDPDFKPLIDLGFLEVASGCEQMLASDTKCDTEAEAETEAKERKRQTRSRAPSVVLPDWMPADSWSEFVKFRKQIKAPMTDRAQELALKKLATLKDEGNDPVAVIEQSMINGWKGLFEVKEPKKSPAKAAQEYRTQRQRIISQ